MFNLFSINKDRMNNSDLFFHGYFLKIFLDKNRKEDKDLIKSILNEEKVLKLNNKEIL